MPFFFGVDNVQTNLTETRAHKRRWKFALAVAGLVLLTTVATFLVLIPSSQRDAFGSETGISCQNPSIRREWRTLTNSEKARFIEALQCLQATPSMMNEDSSRFDDYPWIHQNVGKFSS